jgi:hypothetical protein
MVVNQPDPNQEKDKLHSKVTHGEYDNDQQRYDTDGG